MDKLRARKSTWLAFGLVALAGLAAASDPVMETTALAFASPPDPQASLIVPPGTGEDGPKEDDRAAEATRAYKHAMTTLGSLTSQKPTYKHHDPAFSASSSPSSLLSTFLPNLQAQGPITSIVRIAFKLQQLTGLQYLISAFAKDKSAPQRRRDEEARSKAVKVLDLLHHSAELGNIDALYTLAQLSLFPPTDHFTSDPQLAYDSLSKHAELSGNASSQALLAFFHATGYKNIVPVDQARAQLYYNFAAHAGDSGAQMAVAYRYWLGIGALEDCGRALEWYELASEKAMEKFLSGPPGGLTVTLTPTRLSDLVGGVYGLGASVASSGNNGARNAIRAGIARNAGETWEDLMDYYVLNAERGETDYAWRLGRMYYQGSIYEAAGGAASGGEGVGAVPRSYSTARRYFMSVARKQWSSDPADPLDYQPVLHKDEASIPRAGRCAGYLGRMFLRGEGVKANAAMAKMWFERGAEFGDQESINGLGIIYRDGLVGPPNPAKALKYFGVAAGQDLAEAQVNIGKSHYVRGELKLASAYFEAAIRNGSPFEAYYYLAELQGNQAHNQALAANTVTGSCSVAVSFHKVVAERGAWGNDLVRDAEIAWSSGTERGKETAMLKWWIAAERGSEIAQSNLAFVLDQDKSILRLTRFSPIQPSNDTAKLALTQWTRSAAQRNVDSLVKVGDYYYHGLGVSDDSESLRLEKAARYYQSAADTQMSALAMWNLGWMYENGVGVPQDYHLAKRHYDMAQETTAEAYLPVQLSLIKLYARSLWHTLRGGKDGLRWWQVEDEETVSKPKQAETNANDEDEEHHEDHTFEDEDWYMGKAQNDFHGKKARAEFHNRDHARQAQMEDDDPVQWARDRRNAEQDRDTDWGPEDYFDGATRLGEQEDMRETMILVVLCVAISALVYMRTRLVERIRRQREQEERNQGDPPQPAQPALGGVLPGPDGQWPLFH